MSRKSVENLTKELKDILLKTKKELKNKDYSRFNKKRISKFA